MKSSKKVYDNRESRHESSHFNYQEMDEQRIKDELRGEMEMLKQEMEYTVMDKIKRNMN